MQTRLIPDMPEAEYHADPCEGPSLTASVAKKLLQSPAHAYLGHPKLGAKPMKPMKPNDAMIKGSIMHALVLEDGRGLEIIKFKDYKSDAAKAAKAEAIDAGLLPVVKHKFEAFDAAAAGILANLEDVGIVLGGKSEQTILWPECACEYPDQIQCRARLDHIHRSTVYDLKTAANAHPDELSKKIVNSGLDLQAAAYLRAASAIMPEFADELEFVWLFAELDPPYATVPVRLTPQMRELGEWKWLRAVDLWGRCLRDNEWPGYADGILDLDPPGWAMAAMRKGV